MKEKDKAKELKSEIKEILSDDVKLNDPKQVSEALKAAPEEKLSDEQKKVILDVTKKEMDEGRFPRINDLVKLLYPDRPKADGRSKEGILIKNFLASLNIKTVGAQHYVPEKEIELTDAQKEYIANNISPEMGVVKLAEEIFQKKGLTNLNQEVRAVVNYVETLPPQVVNKTEFDDIPKGMYRPPRTINSLIWKINSYFKETNTNGFDPKNLSSKQVKGLQALIGFINTYRFIYQINLFQTENDRKLFESTFMRHTYDKPDLSQEEVDQYIMVATETVNLSKSWQRKETLEQLQDEAADGLDGDEKFEATMRLVEAIGKANTAYNDAQKRVNDLLDALKVKRSKKLEQKIQENASILNLVEAWKNEESRKQIIEVVEKQRENLDREINRLDNMEEIKCRILGLDHTTIMDG